MYHIFKNVLSFTLLTVLCLSIAPVSTRAQQDKKREEKAAKVKAAVQKLGTGDRAVVKVKLYDKTEYTGYVSRAGEQDFEITDNAAKPHLVNYLDVRSIGGKNLSTGAKIGIGIGIGAGLTILVLLIIIEHYG